MSLNELRRARVKVPRRPKGSPPVVEVAARVLRETNNPKVMTGDSGLLHCIADALGWPHDGPATERKVLDALSRSAAAHPGVLVEQMCRGGWRGAGRVRAFCLPEEDPVVDLVCSLHVCGKPTRGRQWWRCVRGYGLCSECAEKSHREFDAQGMKHGYGVRGVNYDIQPKGQP